MDFDNDSIANFDFANFNPIISGQTNMWSNTFADLEIRRQETMAAVEEANAHKPVLLPTRW